MPLTQNKGSNKEMNMQVFDISFLLLMLYLKHIVAVQTCRITNNCTSKDYVSMSGLVSFEIKTVDGDDHWGSDNKPIYGGIKKGETADVEMPCGSRSRAVRWRLTLTDGNGIGFPGTNERYLEVRCLPLVWPSISTLSCVPLPKEICFVSCSSGPASTFGQGGRGEANLNFVSLAWFLVHLVSLRLVSLHLASLPLVSLLLISLPLASLPLASPFGLNCFPRWCPVEGTSSSTMKITLP